MNSNVSTTTARSAAGAVLVAAALTATALAPATSAPPAPPAEPAERPCFIVQPRWNTGLDGPAPTCAAPARSTAVVLQGGDLAPRYLARA